MTTAARDPLIEIDSIIDHALALPALGEFWRVPGGIEERRMRLLTKFFEVVAAEDGDPNVLAVVAARTVDRLNRAFENCTCTERDQPEPAAAT